MGDREWLIDLTMTVKVLSSGSANFANGVFPYLGSVDIVDKILKELYDC